VALCFSEVPYEERYDYETVNALEAPPGSHQIDVFTVRAAWQRAINSMVAKGMSPVPDWVQPPVLIQRVRHNYVVDLARNDYLFGLYLHTRHLDPNDGTMVIAERIVIFLDNNAECMLEQTLTHELLHSLHARLNHLGPAYRMVAPEEFVEYFVGKPDYSCLYPEETAAP
jgi:hypothetical protein